jgi:hypothetical protein
MKCRRIIGDRHTYWNIKGCGDAARVFTGKFFFFRRKGCGHFCPKRGTNVPPHVFYISRHFDCLKGRKYMAKPRTERSLLFPSKEFREQVRKASKDRGFRSEQAFILAACEREIRRGDNAEAVTQFEARVAATLTNLAKQGQSLHTLAQAQVALTDVLLKYVITCVVEPPDDALPAARVRARLRYEKLVRAAAKEISNKNRDTLREMLADE